jgi:DNA polymerase-3 subunit alpha (Gram-positive type)
LTKLFQISHGKAHRAIEDAKATANLLIFLLHILSRKNIKKVNQIYYPRKKFELDQCHYKDFEELKSHEHYLNEINIPILCTVKGRNGIILSIFPLLNFKKNQKIIYKAIQGMPWKMLTLKLMSSPLQGLFYLYRNIQKIPPQYSMMNLSLIQNYLFSSPLSHDSVSPINYDDQPEHFTSLVLSHFKKIYLLPHIIPQQFMAIHLDPTILKQDFIFRFPAHQLKLNQFLLKMERRIQHYLQQKNQDLFAYTKNKYVTLQLIDHYCELEKNPYLQEITGAHYQKSQLEKDQLQAFLKKYEKHDLFNFPNNHL